ncbi:MAG: isoleucine--tRNA ligase, partial [Patescibacteria group bacterium]
MDIPKKEQEILALWDRTDAFRKSIEQRPALHSFVFYDGPPFATGLPHYGHIVPGTMKDMIPRYKAMCGYRVERRWGWDCHGLPVENLIEKELGLKTKKDILSYGIDRFNEACRASVSRYVEEWKDIIRRTGRWVDMDNAYHTMDPEYMESIWWVFGELYKKGLLYEGRKPMHICPRCETPLSNFEVTLGYKDVTDPAVTVKFKLRRVPRDLIKSAGVKPVYLLAWTTTPWTLPGNMFLAVNPAHDYVAVEFPEEVVVLARERYKNEYEKFGGDVLFPYIKGTELNGLEYEPMFPYFKDRVGAFRVVNADFVTLTEGTGVVHIAPAFGEDDLRVGEREKVDIIQHVGMDGKFKDEVADFRGRFVKSADKDIVAWLKEHGKLFEENTVTHSYPHCWRCDTPLLNYATTSWFVEVTAIKNQLIKQNKEGINWVPEHMRDGRFGMWLEGARDWSISRARYWGTPLPVWRAADGDVIVVNSKRELEALSGETITDLHKHIVDKLAIVKDGKEYRRIPDVLDCWFESGAMPYGSLHYPFENKEYFEEHFPAEFIGEGQDQTRGWFYTLHVLAIALFGRPAFKNVVVNGMVMAEDGKKMSKRLKNYPEITEVLDRYGADALRFYLMNSSVVHAENLNFSEKGVDEVYKKVILILENVLAFWEMYQEGAKEGAGVIASPAERGEAIPSVAGNVLDHWITARLHELIRDVTNAYEAYDLQGAARPIAEFVNDLSTWFVRRSRDRFKAGGEEKQQAAATLAWVLREFSKVIAPLMPFLAERVY